jgi:hypothetical protein
MFLLLALLCGLIVGWARGGSLVNLARLPLRYSWLILIAFPLQVVIFSPQFESQTWSDRLGPVLYIFSILLLMVAVGLNLSLSGMKVLGLGLLLNFLVIAANGGYMPVSLDNLTQAGLTQRAELLRAKGHLSNSIVLTSETRLSFLADVFFIPSYLPFSNVFSIGDVFIGIGIFIIVLQALQGNYSASSA